MLNVLNILEKFTSHLNLVAESFDRLSCKQDSLILLYLIFIPLRYYDPSPLAPKGNQGRRVEKGILLFKFYFSPSYISPFYLSFPNASIGNP